LVLPSLPSLALNLRHSFCDRPRGSMEEGTLLAELFMLRIDAMVRASNPQNGNNSDARFVPIKLPTPVTKNSPARLIFE
jgi:hypothetical protein